MIEKIPSSAITTWSGFLYQGQIALLHTLKILLEDFHSKYSLQLDSLEDFAIVDDSKGNIVPVSLHQVKALKSQYYSTYKKAFEKLNIKVSQCGKLYFHLARNITDAKIIEIEKDYSNIKIYEYETDTYSCSLCSIQKALVEMTKNVYSKHFPKEPYKIVDCYLERSIHMCTQIIINKVIEIHQATHDGIDSDDRLAFERIIPLEEFRSIFNQDLYQRADDAQYFKYLALEDFQRYYEEFMFEFAEGISPEDREKLDMYMNAILGMDKDNLGRFLKGIHPDREYKFQTITDYKDTCLDKESLEDVFFEILKSFQKGSLEECHIQWYCKNGNCYSPTAISRSKSRTSHVCRKIIENSKDTDVTLLFEGNTLITKEITSDSLYSDAGCQLVNEELEENHIMRVSKIGMIDIETARRILNER